MGEDIFSVRWVSKTIKPSHYSEENTSWRNRSFLALQNRPLGKIRRRHNALSISENGSRAIGNGKEISRLGFGRRGTGASDASQRLDMPKRAVSRDAPAKVNLYMFRKAGKPLLVINGVASVAPLADFLLERTL